LARLCFGVIRPLGGTGSAYDLLVSSRRPAAGSCGISAKRLLLAVLTVWSHFRAARAGFWPEVPGEVERVPRFHAPNRVRAALIATKLRGIMRP
jgi:hypothetical protein